MADGRRNNGGHSTKGYAGRKPKADEIKLIETIRSAMNPGDEAAIWKKIIKEAKAGSKDHINILCNRLYGKPREYQNIDLNVEEIILRRK